MNIDKNVFGTYFLRKKAPALELKGGGAVIGYEYVLGLRLQPAPVFHFLGAGEPCVKNGAAHRGRPVQNGRNPNKQPLFLGGCPWGVAFCEQG
jgi:hypothetical protein